MTDECLTALMTAYQQSLPYRKTSNGSHGRESQYKTTKQELPWLATGSQMAGPGAVTTTVAGGRQRIGQDKEHAAFRGGPAAVDGTSVISVPVVCVLCMWCGSAWQTDRQTHRHSDRRTDRQSTAQPSSALSPVRPAQSTIS